MEHKVKFKNENIVIIDGKPYISLKRSMENRSSIAEEYKLIIEQNEQVLEENNHLKEILKHYL